MLHAIATVDNAIMWLEWILRMLIGVAGLVGAVIVATTRADVFVAGDRKQKWVWFAILLASAAATYLMASFVWIFAIVAIGVYWFDVYPQLRDISKGNSGWI